MGTWGRCGVAGAEGRRLQLGPASIAIIEIIEVLNYGIIELREDSYSWDLQSGN